jgi:catechol 2,3-dioxygenase-like lactoylglutathione lyase family enzyme
MPIDVRRIDHTGIPDGARRGTLFVYVHDPDGVTLELIQPPASTPDAGKDRA